MLRLLLAIAIVLVAPSASAAGSTCDVPSTGSPCIRVLFVGNSYTYVNDLPTVFRNLARPGGERVEADIAATGGATLSDQVTSAETQAKLASSRWNFVVLQEQSQIPAIPQLRAQQMEPAALALVRKIEQARAIPVLFVTWAHRDGWPENGLPTYGSMQSQIDASYVALGDELFVPLAPVGPAWSMVLAVNGHPDLWQSDGSHPSEAGTYLAACVFYATLFGRTPVALPYTDGLPQATVNALQAAAANAVLPHPQRWHLDVIPSANP